MILLPRTRCTHVATPLIFLAGPIDGAPHWQETAIDLIRAADPAICIACPRPSQG